MPQFYRVAHQTIQDGLVVRYKEIDAPGGLQISVSRNGYAINGHSSTFKYMSDITDVLERATQIQNAIAGGLRSSDIDAMSISQEPLCVVETRHAVFCGDDEVLERREF